MDSFFDPNDARSWFEQLTLEIPWKQEPIRMFGKKVMQPRLTAWVADKGLSYRYSGIEMKPLPWNQPLIEIKMQIQKLLGTKFNSVLLNLYRDGRDSMGWHRDNEPELGRNPLIASVSLGEPRRFLMRLYSNPETKIEFLLNHGSLLVMAGECQTEWEHSIPKSLKINSPRINLTFRRILT